MLRSPLHSSLAQAARGAEAAGRRGRKQDRQEIVRPVSDNRERERDMMRWKSGVEYVSRATGWHMIAAAAAAPITVLLFRLFPADQTRSGGGRRHRRRLLSHFADLVTSVLTDFPRLAAQSTDLEREAAPSSARPHPPASSENFPVVQPVAVRDETAWGGREGAHWDRSAWPAGAPELKAHHVILRRRAAADGRATITPPPPVTARTVGKRASGTRRPLVPMSFRDAVRGRRGVPRALLRQPRPEGGRVHSGRRGRRPPPRWRRRDSAAMRPLLQTEVLRRLSLAGRGREVLLVGGPGGGPDVPQLQRLRVQSGAREEAEDGRLAEPKRRGTRRRGQGSVLQR